STSRPGSSYPYHSSGEPYPSDAVAPSSTSSSAPPEDQSNERRASTSTTSSSTAKPAGASNSGSSNSTAGATKTKSKTESTPKTFRFEGSISSESFKTTKSFDLAGVNILNRKPLDTKTALDKLQRRRETHNRVERKRRDCINQ
ncbi:hypothetical protein BGW42_007047, partial [Actinomortierella wolfii]